MKKLVLQDKKFLLAVVSIILLVLLIPHGPVSAVGEGIAEDIFTWIMTLLLQIVGAITYLGGTILNFVVKISIVDMKKYVDAAGIDNAWGVIRDVANMGFIFILLYAAIMTILGKGSDNKRLIVNIVLAAVLINFSLFFTKLFIDATNLIALLFYGQMVPASELVRDSAFQNQGLASTIMESIKIQSIWAGSTGDGVSTTQILIVGLLGSIVALVSAFVFFAIAILFIIRFVVLLITMVLSPLAFLAFALPQAEKYRKQWWDALSGQAVFAPIYFLLTWVVISIAQKLSLSEAIQGTGNWADVVVTKAVTGPGGEQVLKTESNPQSIGIIVNFGIIIALLIASLTIAKEWANQAGGQVKALTKWATGAAGGLTMGMAGRAGRNTFGRVGAAIGESETLKDAASKGGVGGMAARLSLAAGRKTSKASFDLRGSPLGGAIDGGKAQKGGFEKILKDKRKEEADFAKSLGPSDMLTADAERDLEKAKADKKTVENIDITNPDFVREHEEAKSRQDEVVREKYEKLQELENLSAAGTPIDPQDIAIAENELRDEQNKLAKVNNIEEYKLSKKQEAESNVKKAQDRVDELKGVNEDEAKKRVRKAAKERMELGDSKEDRAKLKDYLESDTGQAEIESVKIKSLGDTRKNQFVETLANSPTQRVAGAIGGAAQRVGETRMGQGIRESTIIAGQKLDEFGNKIAERGEEIKMPTFGRWVGNAVSDVAGIRSVASMTARAAGEIPNLIRAKNRAAISEIKKKKESAKDLIDKALKATGEKKEESAEASEKSTPESVGGKKEDKKESGTE